VIPKEAVELLALVFDPRGSYIQDIMIEEAAACADALSRDAARRAVAALAGIGGGGGGGGSGGLGSGSVLLAVEPGDDEALENVRELVAFLADAASASAAAAGVQQQRGSQQISSSRGLVGAASSARKLAVALRDLRPVAPALAAGIGRTGEGIARALAGRVIARLGAASSSSSSRNGAGASSSYDADAAFRATAEGRTTMTTTATARRPAAAVATAAPAAAAAAAAARRTTSAAASAAVAPPTGLFPAAAAAALPVLLLPLTAPLWIAQQVMESLP